MGLAPGTLRPQSATLSGKTTFERPDKEALVLVGSRRVVWASCAAHGPWLLGQQARQATTSRRLPGQQNNTTLASRSATVLGKVSL